MAKLKKLRSATLIEALVATVLIVVVFMMASLVLNNLLLNSFSANTQGVETKMAELGYYALNGKLTLPYNDSYKKWDIHIQKDIEGESTSLKISAVNKESKKEINKRIPCGKKN